MQHDCGTYLLDENKYSYLRAINEFDRNEHKYIRTEMDYKSGKMKQNF